MSFHILITDPLNEAGLQPLLDAENIHVTIDTSLTPEQLADKIVGFDALLVRSQTQVTRELIQKAKNLKIIGRAGVGIDNIDLGAATEHGIIVVNAPNANTNAAAEHTIAMILTLSRNIPQAYFALKNGEWNRSKYIGTEVKDKTLGIVGLGKIGAEVAYRAKGQRMNVIAYDPFLTEEQAIKMGIGCGTLEEVLATSDFITVHTPLIKATKHLISTEAFKQMKPTAYIVNCARGGIIDEEALYEAITSKQIAGAALDVYEVEPAINNKLLDLPEVIGTPHLGASTKEAQENVAIEVSHDVIRFLTGETVQSPINLPSVPKDIIAKIEPYFHLSEKLGAFLIHLTDEAIEEIHIHYSGDLAELNTAALSRNAVKGLLKRHLGNHVNDVNALYLAERKGIAIHESKTKATKVFTNLLTVEIHTKSGKRSVSGTLIAGFGPKIVKIDNYRVDVTPNGHLIFIHHNDQPGVIGKVGMLLGTHNVNIATMQVDRSDIGGNAIMMLTVDKHPEVASLQALGALPEISNVVAIDL